MQTFVTFVELGHERKGTHGLHVLWKHRHVAQWYVAHRCMCKSNGCRWYIAFWCICRSTRCRWCIVLWCICRTWCKRFLLHTRSWCMYRICWCMRATCRYTRVFQKFLQVTFCSWCDNWRWYCIYKGLSVHISFSESPFYIRETIF